MSEVAPSCLTLHLHRLQPARLLFPWDFPGKNTGVDWHFLLQGIFLTGIEPKSSAMQADSSPGRPTININYESFFVHFCLFCTIAYPLLGITEQLSTHTISSSVVQSCLILFDPMNHSIPGLPVHHQLPESTQTHVHWVSDAIQPSHPLSSPSPPAPNPSQHQGLFKWVSSSHQVAKVLDFQLQHQSFQWTPRTDL